MVAIDDRLRMVPFLLGRHLPAKDLAGQQGACEIEIEHKSERLGRQLEEALVRSGCSFQMVAVSSIDPDVYRP